ncbi:MAG: hypothetical protein AAF561_01275 [Planctomycetota bacterium]
MARNFAASLTPIVRARATAICLGIVSSVLGLGIMIYDGMLVSLPQHRLFWLLMGGLAFYGPGAGYLLAWWGLGSGRTWALRIGMLAATVQIGVAIVIASGHGFGKLPTSPMVIAECTLWSAACVILIFQLKRALPWVRTDAESHHGFEVQPLTGR